MTNLDALMAGMKDKEAAGVWGDLAKKLQKEEGDRPTFATRSDGKVTGRVAKVYMRDNFDKDGQDPAVDVETATGTVIVQFGGTVLRKAAIKAMPQKGDVIEVTYAQQKTNGRYFNDKLTVIERADGGPGF